MTVVSLEETRDITKRGSVSGVLLVGGFQSCGFG